MVCMGGAVISVTLNIQIQFELTYLAVSLVNGLGMGLGQRILPSHDKINHIYSKALMARAAIQQSSPVY